MASNCITCTDPDDGNMVACSICLGSYHYACCGIEGNVDLSTLFTWTCQHCSAEQQPGGLDLPTVGAATQSAVGVQQTLPASQHQLHSTINTTAPTPSFRSDLSLLKQLELQQLEEEMLLRQEFLRRKYELLRSNISDAHESQSVRPALVNSTNVCHSVNLPPSVPSPQNGDSMPNSGQYSNLVETPRTSVNVAADNNCGYVQSQPSQQMSNDIIHQGVEYLAQTRTIHNNAYQGQTTNIHHSSPNDHRRNIPHIHPNNTGGCQNNLESVNNTSNSANFTTTQIVARQSISRDLPPFNGDPREWAIFISAFEQSTSIAGYSNEENLIRLQKCLHGRAREVVRNCLMLPDMVPDVIRTLKMYFGRPECIIKSLIDEVRKITLQKGKLNALVEFAFAVKNICATIRASNLNEHLTNPTLLQELVDKLPPDTLLQWAMHSKDMSRPNLIHLSDWLYTIAEATCRVTVPIFTVDDKKTTQKDGRLNTHTTSTTPRAQQCVMCNEDHKVTQCAKFKVLSIEEKWDFVKAKGLCRSCLGKHRRRCWFQKQCGVNGCTVHHNALLHNEDKQEDGTVSNLNSHKSEGESFFRIVLVKLFSGNKSVAVHALMDDGSTLTLLEAKVADALGVQGINDPMCIRWTGDVSRYEDSSQRFDLRISSIKDNAKVFPIRDVHSVKNLNLATETLIVEDLKRRYPHLRDVPIEGYESVTPTMIIGVNNPNLITSTKTIEGEWNQPVATKTRLGWTIFGWGSKVCARLNFHKCRCDELHGLVKEYFSEENLGITQPTSTLMSKDDQQAISILEKTCALIDGRYEVGLLWKTDSPKFPNSLPTAQRRLKCIERKSKGDPELAKILQQQISNLEEKGYAKRLPQGSLNDQEEKIWYLPTFIVRNPHKPNKIRLVWDAAAKSGNYALNDFLLKGPDLLRPLMHILFKFRMGAVAICGDIAEMFHRIKVRNDDAGAQRFLWWDCENGVSVYQLNVLTFGASCSPFIAHYVRDKNADTFGHNPRVVQAIKSQHYVDDFIDSVATVEEAIDLAEKVREVHAKGGFHMRNWSSNCPEVLRALGETNASEDKNFYSNDKPTQYEKILGLYWDPVKDIFKMNLKFVRLRRPILTEEIVPTKRELLQVLMSVFDPLGFVACFMSFLKAILQEVWRSGIDWDQNLNDDLYSKWKMWLKFLPIITDVSIPRCYSAAIQNENYTVDLHVFVDASEDAYAAVSYFRIEFNGQVEIRLVAAKSKVAPLQPLSVPRLELQAAVIGARLANTVSRHGITIKRQIMWTDSKTVLNWLVGDPRKYKQFVMFRVAEIMKLTNITEWRWVPSAKNVADFATKYRPESNNYREWIEGPSWLLNPETEWPTTLNEPNEIDIDKMELRPRFLNLHSRESTTTSFNFEYFSSWYRLCRAVSNWILYIERLQQRCKGRKLENNPEATRMKTAKLTIFKEVQKSSFPDEYVAVQSGKPIPQDSVLGKLCVYMDEGIVKVKNRARYATPLCGRQLDFIVLPGSHQVTRLLVHNYHLAYHHLNHETVLNEIRQIYFIPKLRVLYRIVRRCCQRCKNEAAKPTPPQMALLPPARLGAFQRPFTFVGVDYFGPMTITLGRKSLKRWGVLLTCLTIRAVHIEIAHSLSTDSLLMALRNFIARRGVPAEIYSDNGTNFRGADSFFKAQLNDVTIETELAKKGITWKFNPPAAPHMGGAWERLVRSVKTILYKISPSQKFTDENLKTALMEVELIINSRPLTYVSLETEDQEAITPNHFLLGSSNGAKPFCKEEDINHRMCLRQSEAFANMFWRRFVKEMLPTLTRRCKWTQPANPVKVGDIVIVVNENAERNSWLKGTVVEITKANDGQVRRAKVRTMNGVIERPAVKLAVLDVAKEVE